MVFRPFALVKQVVGDDSAFFAASRLPAFRRTFAEWYNVR
jgi:hypothetical protein